MKRMRLGVVLLALLLAAMAMVPMVNAENVVPSSVTVGMKYFSDIPETIKSQSSSSVPISEYSLVTVDSTGFMRDADNGNRLECTLDGQPYSIELTPVPSIIAPGAKIYVKTNEGTTIADVPQIKQYKGRIIGNKTGDAFFTVDKDVILGRIKTGNESYFIDQSGQQSDGKIVHIVYNARNEVVRTKLPNGNDIFPATNSRSFQTVPENDQATNAISPLSVSTVSLLAVYDPQFHTAYPSSSTEIVSMMSTVGNAFSPSYIGVNFQINAFTSDSTLTSTDKDTLITQLITSQRSSRDSTSSDLVSLFTGRDLDGDDIGNAGQYTYGVVEASAYSVEQMTDSGTSYTASSYQRPIVITHELGHNFGAMHQNYSGGSVEPTYIPSYARAATWTAWFTTHYSAMWTPFQTGTSMSNEFSATDTGHGDSDHNNALRISLQKATVAGYK